MTCWIVAPLLFLATACNANEVSGGANAAHSSDDIALDTEIRRTDIQLTSLVFLPEQERVATVGDGVFDLCVDDTMSPDFKVSTILAWTGRTFRTTEMTKSRCAFSVQSVALREKSDNEIETEDCISQLKMAGDQILSIRSYVKGNTSRHYFQCEYRLSMAFIGYLGALSMDEDKLFVEVHDHHQQFGLPFWDMFSSIMPAPFVHLQFACVREGLPYVFLRGMSRKDVISTYLDSKCRKIG